MVERISMKIYDGDSLVLSNQTPDYCYGFFEWECHIAGRVHAGTAMIPEDVLSAIEPLIEGKKQALCKITETVTYAEKDAATCKAYALSMPGFFKNWFVDKEKKLQIAKEATELPTNLVELPDDYYFKNDRYVYISYFDSASMHVKYVRVKRDALTTEFGAWKLDIGYDGKIERILLGNRFDLYVYHLSDFYVMMRVDVMSFSRYINDLPTLNDLESISKEDFVKAYKTANTVSYSTI